MTASTPARPYCGRFAPSPTGPLHMGSLVAALASYLDARRNHGRWLLRIDDIDPARQVQGAIDNIQGTLERFGLHWDGEPILQSRRRQQHEHALALLRSAGHAYPCACTRREVARVARAGPNGLIYPGTCREGLPPGRLARTLRVDTRGAGDDFVDLLQGPQGGDLASQTGDFIISRADGCIAYHLAAAVDDGEEDITHVVRGADLLPCTAPQRYLMRLLGLSPPVYLHVPIAVNDAGQKLSKQTHAPALTPEHAPRILFNTLGFLGQAPPDELAGAPVSTLLAWAVAHWDPEPLRGTLTKPSPDATGP